MAKYRLGEIAPINQGVVPNNDQYWLLNLDMVESNTGTVLDYVYVDDSQIGASTVSFDTSNVLYSKLRPYLNKVVLPDRAGYATSEMLPLKPDEKIIIREYLTYFLRSPHFVNYINEKTSGAKMPRANISDLKSYEIDCPPVMEQQRIVLQFDSIRRIIQIRQYQLTALDELIKARFVELFEDGESPIKTVEELCSIIVDCPHTTPSYKGELKNPAIRTSEIKRGYIVWDSMRYVSDEEYEERVSRLRPEAGDIVYGREGTFGNAAVLPEGYKFCLGQRVMLLRPDYTKCTSEYLLHAVISDDVYHQAIGKNNASTVAHVNVKDVKQFKIPMPSFDKQHQFAEFVKQVDKSKAVIQKSLDETQVLFDSLMQQYFG